MKILGSLFMITLSGLVLSACSQVPVRTLAQNDDLVHYCKSFSAVVYKAEKGERPRGRVKKGRGTCKHP